VSSSQTRRRSAIAEARGQEPLPIQPVPRPILCNPYEEPDWHWLYDTQTGAATKTQGRRDASYWFRSQRTSAGQLSLLAQEESDPLPLVNALRDDVRRWRKSEWDGATTVTKQLLRHWTRADRARRLFFCQREAVETAIYLTEILAAGKTPRFKPKLTLDDFERLRRGERVSFAAASNVGLHASLADIPNEAGLAPLVRYGCKMATGSGKTVVMAMLVAWAFCNRGRVPGNDRFANAALIVCPNLTIKERLQVLRPEHAENYYEAFDIVPPALVPELRKGRVLVTNWHAFAPESPHAEGGRTYAVVNKGAESNAAFARRVLGDLADRGPIMVLNDEAHHAYRPAPVEDEVLSKDERAEREEATVWIAGLDRINAAVGVSCCVDLSATPFYLHGSGYVEGSPFPWLVSDFGLVDAIESGIVKIPRIPVSDTTGRPEPKYFALWEHITTNLRGGEKLPGGKPKPEVVWRDAQDALLTLASQWVERFERASAAKPGQELVPPVLIVVCDNTDIAELFYERISGERAEPADPTAVDADDDEEDDLPKRRGKRPKTRTVFGQGSIFPDFFSNTPDRKRTLRIDSRLLAEAESGEGASRKDAAELLREVVATVGKPGQVGEHVRCVVSVQMLTEGWDANNVTQILGLRRFGSQLLCEQVVGRGLRRMDYTPDPESGLLTEEYVDVYGVPFSVIPFKGREVGRATPDDTPKNHVRSLPERSGLMLRFPVVEGYVIALRSNLIRADVAAIEPIVLEPDRNPTAVFVKPQVGHQMGTPDTGGGFQLEEQDRQAYYESTHLQTITFEIAREIVRRLTDANAGPPKLALSSRHQLFPQVYRIVHAYVDTRVSARGCDKRELGLETYMRRTVERLVAAIEPDHAAGEPPLLPLLNRSQPVGDTSRVSFKTIRPCVATVKSQIDQVVADTGAWEQAAVFRLEQSPVVASYARNDHVELSVPYEFLGTPHAYFPDFLVRLTNGLSILLEIKGEEDERDRAKYQAARRWVSAVNRWGREGPWEHVVCRDPQQLGGTLSALAARLDT
jgi:type III restriction enzyme